MDQIGEQMEIRKLPMKIRQDLRLILDYADYWKQLMEFIPRRLSKETFKSDIDSNNPPKYNSFHFKSLEEYCKKSDKSPTQQLFDEWGCSSRPRPLLGHLKYLLIKANLFRAADYIANILGEEPPPRPKFGPAARVEIPLPDKVTEEVTKRLNGSNNPQVVIEQIGKQSSETNKNPVQMILDIKSTDLDSTISSFNIPLVLPQSKIQTDPDISSMIQFSSSQVSAETSTDSSYLPIVLCSPPVSSNQESTIEDPSKSPSDFVLPAFSALLSDKQETASESQPISDLIPSIRIVESESDPSSADNQDVLIPLQAEMFCSELLNFPYDQLKKATSNFATEKSSGKFLGAGAFGSVFLAADLLPDRAAAVKKLSADNTELSVDYVSKQFRNEVETLYKYKHKNLVSLLGFSCDGEAYCLVYEYISGGSLFDTLQKQPQSLSWKQRFQVAFGTAEGLVFLHTAYSTPLIHRDIKSANILLDSTHNVKICDFGIAKLLSEDETSIVTMPIGTSAYMAPEYHAGEVSVKVDTYSFGVVLLELLTSLPPIDYNREGGDLVTYIECECADNTVEPVLDKTVGSWQDNNRHFGQILFDLALLCLEDQQKRPCMVDVLAELEKLSSDVSNLP